jgi:hypothetical protein
MPFVQEPRSLCKLLGSGARRTTRLNVLRPPIAAWPPSPAIGSRPGSGQSHTLVLRRGETPAVSVVPRGCDLFNKARRGGVNGASLRGQFPRDVEEIDGPGAGERIGACQTKMTRDLTAASAAAVGVEEEERVAGHELVVAVGLPRSHDGAAE